jgi:hypothetical protein
MPTGQEDTDECMDFCALKFDPGCSKDFINKLKESACNVNLMILYLPGHFSTFTTPL